MYTRVWYTLLNLYFSQYTELFGHYEFLEQEILKLLQEHLRVTVVSVLKHHNKASITIKRVK